jgi:hypothetical protein
MGIPMGIKHGGGVASSDSDGTSYFHNFGALSASQMVYAQCFFFLCVGSGDEHNSVSLERLSYCHAFFLIRESSHRVLCFYSSSPLVYLPRFYFPGRRSDFLPHHSQSHDGRFHVYTVDKTMGH